MKSIFDKTRGVGRFDREGHQVVLEHDASVFAVEQLMRIFRGLLSFYRSRFVPLLMDNPGRRG
jgi:hypothetical protein